MSLNTAVLILNRSYVAVSILTVRRAMCLLSKNSAKALGDDFRLYTYEEWLEIEPGDDEEYIQTPRRRVAVPRIIVLTAYDSLPRREVRFSRKNVFMRDRGECGYCGYVGRPDEMNLDHVCPVSQGGRSEWTNITLSCRPCNTAKEDRTPEQAHMTLRRRPQKPSWMSWMAMKSPAHASWGPFLIRKKASK